MERMLKIKKGKSNRFGRRLFYYSLMALFHYTVTAQTWLDLTRFRTFSFTIEYFIVPRQRGEDYLRMAATVALSCSPFWVLSSVTNTPSMDQSVIFCTAAI